MQKDEAVINEGNQINTITTHYQYSEGNQVVVLIEAARTRTKHYLHTVQRREGQKSCNDQPDGVRVDFEYDTSRGLKKLASSESHPFLIFMI